MADRAEPPLHADMSGVQVEHATSGAANDEVGSIPPKQPGRILGFIKATAAFLLSQWLLLAMGLVVLLAHFFPNVGKQGGHIASQWSITYGAVILIFLTSGLSLPFDKLVKHARNIRLHLIVQITSFFLTSAVFFAVAVAAHSSSYIETSTLVGLIGTGCLPTAINSNVVMTRQAGGDVAATMVSVTLGNFIGPFLTPILLAKVYLPAVPGFAQWLPVEALNNMPAMYASVMKQMGLSVFLPLLVGQVIRGIWPEKTQKVIEKFKLAKLGSICLLALIWATFCTAFATGSLETINTPTIIFNVFVNIALCSFFTVLSFYMARPPRFLSSRAPRLFRQIDKPETMAICFCAPAKTQALGIPLIAAMYTTSDAKTQALLQIPMILYTAEQIFVGQVLIVLFKRWTKKDAEEKLIAESQLENRESIGTVNNVAEDEKNIATAV